MKREIGTKLERKLLTKLANAISFKVYADEVDNTTPPKVDPPKEEEKPSINYENLIAQARKEEKDKMYVTINDLKSQLTTMTENNNSNLIVIGELKSKIAKLEEDLGKKVEDTQTVKDLQAQIEVLKGEKETLKASIRQEVENELEEKNKLNTFKATKVEEFKKDIIPTYLDEVKGNNEEEILASIEEVKKKSLKVKQDLGLVDEQGNVINITKKNDNNPPPTNPDKKGKEELDLAYLATLDVRSPEYAEYRKKMGLDKKGY